MAANQYVYLVRMGDAAIRAYTDAKQLKGYLEALEPHLLQRFLIQRLQIGDVENRIDIRVAADLLALWKAAGKF